MRALKFTHVEQFKGSRIEYSKVNSSSAEYYEKVSAVVTKYGIVWVYEFDWQTNEGKIIFSLFKTTMGDMEFSAELKEVRLSDIQLKWLSTNFMHQIIDKHLR